MVVVEAPGFARRMLRTLVEKGRPLSLPVSQEGGTLIVEREPRRESDDLTASGAFVAHAGCVVDLNSLEVWSQRQGAKASDPGRLVVPATEAGEYTTCRASLPEYAAMAAGVRLPGRCVTGFLPTSGELTLKIPSRAGTSAKE